MNDFRDSRELPDFSLVLGGPLYQLLVRSRLATPAFDLVKRRVVVISLFAWLPLLILSLLNGTAWGDVGLPFLHDIEMQTRFLVVLPLLIGGELLVHQRLRLIVGQFVDRNIITEAVLPRFRDVIASATKLRNSVALELILFFLIYFGGYPLELDQRHGNDRAPVRERGSPARPLPEHGSLRQATGTSSPAGPSFSSFSFAGISGCSSGPVFSGRRRGSNSISSRPTRTVRPALAFWE